MGETLYKKHYLDTSVLRSLLLGSQLYKKYFSSQFGNNPCYISKYIKMEFRRSFLRNILYFYFTFRIPTLNTIDDVLRYWSNKYAKSELKAIIQLAAELFKTGNFDFTNPRDKPKALRHLALLIKRFDAKLRRNFKDIGKDTARCTRASIPLKAELMNIAKGFKDFLEAFEDVKFCRSKCHIDNFLLTRYHNEINKFIKKARELPSNNDTIGFKNISENLSKILNKGPNKCSCRMCEKIGDAIIALEAPRKMRLEHTDFAFNYLCPLINQPHKKHPSEVSLISDKIVEQTT